MLMAIQSTKKRLKITQYFKNKLLPQGILFLQETHSTQSNVARWRDEFNAALFFSRRSSNSCRILILNVTIDAKNFFLINLYNPNTENEQVDV